jgi:hypothetical protein
MSGEAAETAGSASVVLLPDVILEIPDATLAGYVPRAG